MTIGERMRIVRKELGLNQTDFGEKIGFKQALIGQMENGSRNVLDRTILLMCEKYGIREEWLRDGTGEMFNIDSTIITQLSSEYDLDGFERAMIEGFLKMRPEERKVIKSYVQNLLDKLMTDEEAYRDYREEYIADRALPFAARGGDTSNLQEAADLYDSAPPDDEKDGE